MSRDTTDQEFVARRQRFLAEQGYAYQIVDAEAVLSAAARRGADELGTGLDQLSPAGGEAPDRGATPPA